MFAGSQHTILTKDLPDPVEATYLKNLGLMSAIINNIHHNSATMANTAIHVPQV